MVLIWEGNELYDMGNNLMGEVCDGSFVPSRFLLELDAVVQARVDEFARSSRPELFSTT